MQPKRVVHHANVQNPQRCLVHIYKKYLQHRPKIEEPALYLTPLKKPKDAVWYTKTPIGHNTLAKTVARVCQAGGVPGFKTNHSLRVTTATLLFQRGVDEQLIMARTGHRSIEGVRTYKRISEQQVKDVSTLLNDANNGAPAAKKCKVTRNKLSRKPLLPTPFYLKQVVLFMLVPVLFAQTKKLSQTHLFLQHFISLVVLT